jgi:hypothetical protein
MHLTVPLPDVAMVATVCDAAPAQYGVDPLPPGLGVLPSVVHQNVVFESRPGFEPFGLETFVLEMVTMDPDTESTGATLVIVPWLGPETLPEQEGEKSGPSSLFILLIPQLLLDPPT